MNKAIFELAKNDFRTKYNGSAFCAFWGFCQPVITTFIYWFVFQVTFDNNSVDGFPYVLWLISGLVPWFFFSECWGGISGVLSDYSFLVKKMVFDVRLLPLIRLLSCLFIHLCFVLITFIITFCYGVRPSMIHIQILYYIVAVMVFVYGIGKIFCVLTTFFKDAENLVKIFIQFGFWLTPLFWNVSAIPQNFVWFFKLNPMFYIVQGFRDTFLYNKLFYQDWRYLLYYWTVSLLVFKIGEYLFKKSSIHFADVI